MFGQQPKVGLSALPVAPRLLEELRTAEEELVDLLNDYDPASIEPEPKPQPEPEPEPEPTDELSPPPGSLLTTTTSAAPTRPPTNHAAACCKHAG